METISSAHRHVNSDDTTIVPSTTDVAVQSLTKPHSDSTETILDSAGQASNQSVLADSTTSDSTSSSLPVSNVFLQTDRTYQGSGVNTVPEIEERPRTSYSLDANTLRRRHGNEMAGSTSTYSSSISTCSTGAYASTPESSSKSINASQTHTEHGKPGGEYECNICFDTASSPVLTLCGHLFCWPCLHQWLEAQAANPLCPVCKAGCGKDKVIPVYGRGKEAKDPRLNSDIPNRPAGQRPQPTRDPNQPSNFFPGAPFHATQFGHHFTVAAGFGLFPSLFGVQFTFPPGPGNGQPVTPPQQAFVQRLFIMLISLVVIGIFLY